MCDVDPSCLWTSDLKLKPDPSWVTTLRGERIKAEGISRIHCNLQHEAARTLRNARMHAELQSGWGTVSTCPSNSSITRFGFPTVWTKGKALVYVPKGKNASLYSDQEYIQPTVMDTGNAWQQIHPTRLHTSTSSRDPFRNNLRAFMKRWTPPTDAEQ